MYPTTGKVQTTLLVLLVLGIYSLVGPYHVSTSFLLIPGSGVGVSALTLTPGEVAPVAKVDVRDLQSGPSRASSIFMLQSLGAVSTAVTGPAVLSSRSNSSLDVLSEFEGLNQIQSCSCVPPDVQVAAGPSHIMEMVNIEGEIFSKQGVTNKTFALSSFFNTGSDFISDPKVLFDLSSGRWFASLVDVTVNSVLVGVSSTNDPTGIWTLYALSAGGFVPDQPIIGVSDDKFTAGANDFFGNSFAGSQFWILNKSQMLLGTTVSFVTSGANSGFFSIHPVQSLSSTTVQYMVSNIVSRRSLATTAMELFSVTGIPGVTTVTTTIISLTVSTLGIPPGGVQPGTTSTINTGDFRVQDAVWFMGKLWYGLTDACLPSGDTQVRSCIRLTLIDTTASPISVKQDFDSGTSGQYLFYPALRIDAQGDLDLTYGFSSSTIFPSLAATGQATTDPVDSLATPQTLVAGSAVDTSTRYGDYFGAGLDPSHPNIVWVAGEYHSSTTGACGSFGSCWSTRIISVTMAGSVPLSINSLVTFQGYSVTTSGNLTLSLSNLNFSGIATVTARNSSTGGIIFTKTYTITSVKLQNMTTSFQARFLLNIAVTPYQLSSDIIVTLKGGSASASITVTRQVDVDGNGTVEITDLSIVALSLGSSIGGSNYNPLADLDGNGMVNITDLSIAALYFGAINFK